MKIAELIKQLQEVEKMFGPEQVVKAWSPEREGYYPIATLTFGGVDGAVTLDTDEDYS